MQVQQTNTDEAAAAALTKESSARTTLAERVEYTPSFMTLSLFLSFFSLSLSSRVAIYSRNIKIRQIQAAVTKTFSPFSSKSTPSSVLVTKAKNMPARTHALTQTLDPDGQRTGYFIMAHVGSNAAAAAAVVLFTFSSSSASSPLISRRLPGE